MSSHRTHFKWQKAYFYLLCWNIHNICALFLYTLSYKLYTVSLCVYVFFCSYSMFISFSIVKHIYKLFFPCIAFHIWSGFCSRYLVMHITSQIHWRNTIYFGYRLIPFLSLYSFYFKYKSPSPLSRLFDITTACFIVNNAKYLIPPLSRV